jgi:hypothetical protein
MHSEHLANPLFIEVMPVFYLGQAVVFTNLVEFWPDRTCRIL